ncbi:carbohydrate sulfotransferase 1-like [Uloborus diversus]|uniref:carbohydrate sulfotransferase 1-like n=1 Tax=Uloborus diversus TaxID=327109 RepID=UPI002409C779|nr:carbohydrate sulfotransferase 1-like [Uloborus diversus]
MALDRRPSINPNQRIRLRRLLPLFLFLATIVALQFFVLFSKNGYSLRKALPGLSTPRPGPLHVLVVSYARSGSSFLGDLLAELPDAFYYFELLHFLGSSVLNGTDINHRARHLLSVAFQCNISVVDGFMDWQKRHQTFMKLKRSIHYWATCSNATRAKNAINNVCYNATYMDSYCSKKDILIAKTIRIKLPEVIDLFYNPSLNLKVIYLMRDPRGSFNSRNKFPIAAWCKKDVLCHSAKQFCTSLEDDLEAVCHLRAEKPTDFLAIRYEDLAMNPYQTTKTIVRFLGFEEIPKNLVSFLKTHTSVQDKLKIRTKAMGIEFPYSTFRNSAMAATSWRKEMSFVRLTELQKSCQPVLNFFGYHSYSTLVSLRSNIQYDIGIENALLQHCVQNL